MTIIALKKKKLKKSYLYKNKSVEMPKAYKNLSSTTYNINKPEDVQIFIEKMLKIQELNNIEKNKEWIINKERLNITQLYNIYAELKKKNYNANDKDDDSINKKKIKITEALKIHIEMQLEFNFHKIYNEVLKTVPQVALCLKRLKKNLLNEFEKQIPELENNIIDAIYETILITLTSYYFNYKQDIKAISINVILNTVYNLIFKIFKNTNNSFDYLDKKKIDKIKENEKLIHQILNIVLNVLIQWEKPYLLTTFTNKKEKRKNWILILPEVFSTFLDNCIQQQIEFPMIIPPLPWIYNSNIKNFKNGGYLKNNLNKFNDLNYLKIQEFITYFFNPNNNNIAPTAEMEYFIENNITPTLAIVAQKNILQLKANKPIDNTQIIIQKDCCYINEINQLQNIKIDFNFLIFLDIFSVYKFNEFNSLIDEENKNFFDILEILNSTEPNEIKKSRKQIKIEKIKKEIKPIINDTNLLRIYYTLNFILTTIIIKTFFEIKTEINYYFPLYLDFRGRQYYDSMFSHMQNSILRPLIILNPEIIYPLNNKNTEMLNFYIMWQIKKCSSINQTTELLYTEEEYIKTKEFLKFRKPYNWLIIYQAKKNNTSFTISLDACASMLQFFALLTDNQILAELVNLQNTEKINDPYLFLIEKIKEEYLLTNTIDNYKLFEKILTDRAIVKYTIMTTIYGSTAFATIDNLKTQGHLQLFTKKDILKIFIIIIKTFNKYFPGLNIIKNTLKFIAEFLLQKNKPISVKHLSDYPEFSYDYYNLKDVKLVTELEKKKMEITLTGKTINISKKKRQASILANFIHFLDAEVLHKTRVNLKKKGIDSLGIHDCFLINANFYLECVEEYNKNIVKILDLNILNCFSINENEFKEFLIEYRTKHNTKISSKMQTEILNLINLKKIKISKQKLLNSKTSLLPT